MKRDLEVHSSGEPFDVSRYCRALEKRLQFVGDEQEPGEKWEFRRLFFPLRIDEGQFAFKTYKELIERLENKTHDPARDDLIGDIVERLQESLGQECPEELTDERKFEFYDYINHDLSREILHSVAAIKPSTVESHRQRNVLDFGTDDVVRSRSKVASCVDENKRLAEGILDAISLHKSEGVDEKTSVVEIKTSDGTESQATDLLIHEPIADMSGCLVLSNPEQSRILALASAGYGKTTLVRRLALLFCQWITNSLGVAERIDELRLSASYCRLTPQQQSDSNIALVPCIVRLRDMDRQATSLSEVIVESMMTTLEEECIEQDGKRTAREDVCQWLTLASGRLLLLVDGLDELPDGERSNFIVMLKRFMDRNPRTRVIITSRVAGLSEEGVKEGLRSLGFRGRTIMPLDSEEVKKYCDKWIDETQPEEERALLRHMVREVQSQQKYQFLREFMRTPLELLVVLKQIVSNSLSLNRWKMFHDMLWQQISNHEPYHRKQPVFNDVLTFLGFIAYQMQQAASLSISRSRVQELLPAFKHLSFQTEILRNLDVDVVMRLLNALAASVGIVERDNTVEEPCYTFPIRAYQEFMVAYACCHIRLGEAPRPDPYGIVMPHVNDSRWRDVVGYVLSDMENNGSSEFERFIAGVFENCSDIECLGGLIDTDFGVRPEEARILCEKHFGGVSLSAEQKRLLDVCTDSKSAFVYKTALLSLYRSVFDGADAPKYLWALAFVVLKSELSTDLDFQERLCNMLTSGNRADHYLAAMMLQLIARSILEEESLNKQMVQSAIPRLSSGVVRLLYERALHERKLVFVRALTELWVSRIGGCQIENCLTIELAEIVRTHIQESGVWIQRDLLGAGEMASFKAKTLIEAFVTLGSFPPDKVAFGDIINDAWPSAFLEFLYQESIHSLDYDLVAMTIAGKNYSWTWEKFIDRWALVVCLGVPSEHLFRNSVSIREKNHYNLIEATLRQQTSRHLESLEAKQNHLSPLDPSFVRALTRDRNVEETKRISRTTGVFDLFFQGRFLEAAQLCIDQLGRTREATLNNIAFLIRYGKLNTQELQASFSLDIQDLLRDDLMKAGEFATLNLALQAIETGNFERADSLLLGLSEREWRSVTDGFWYTILWLEMASDPEGALVCVLASHYRELSFDGQDEMLLVAQEHYSQFLEFLSIRRRESTARP